MTWAQSAVVDSTHSPKGLDAVFAGADLAADPARTGLVTISDEIDDVRIIVEDARLGVSDEDLIAAVQAAEKTGVDVPLGWPRPFVDLIQGHAAATLDPVEQTGPDWRRSMAMRRTDLVVRDRFGLRPLSVSTDRIAYPALRWAGVEARLRQGEVDVDRDGSGRVCEVYPAAALRTWGLPHRGYKGRWAEAEREALVQQIDRLVPGLDWNGFRGQCVKYDDVLDALIAALVAREAAADRTLWPEGEDRELALQEGWIHVPVGEGPSQRGPQPSSAAAGLETRQHGR